MLGIRKKHQKQCFLYIHLLMEHYIHMHPLVPFPIRSACHMTTTMSSRNYTGNKMNGSHPEIVNPFLIWSSECIDSTSPTESRYQGPGCVYLDFSHLPVVWNPPKIISNSSLLPFYVQSKTFLFSVFSWSFAFLVHLFLFILINTTFWGRATEELDSTVKWTFARQCM